MIAFAQAPSLDALPAVVDVDSVVPANPPQHIQVKCVGLSYEDAYAEAEKFVKASDQYAAKHGPGGFSSMDHIVDFGAGWHRITRTLLAGVRGLDIDPEMTALVNTTLPGVNALTISPNPPTVLGNAAVDALLAFSVFSHLSRSSHEAWASEIGRVVRPGGVVAVTVLDHDFFGQIAGAQAAVAAGSADDFAKSLADTFADLKAAQAGYAAGEIQYAGTGGGEVRTADNYGWAAAPAKYIERIWGRHGFRVVEWIPAGVLFQQALVFMVRLPDSSIPGKPGAARSATAGVTLRRLIRRAKRLGTGRG